MSGSQAPATPSAGGAGGSGAGGGSAGGETAGRHKSVIVHPLVLLSVTDHSYREHREMNKRVLGVLLGEVFQGRVDVTDSFAVPFEEDARDPSIFFLDVDYLEGFYFMHKKVSAKEKIVGFYSTSPKLRAADLAVDALFRRLPFGTPHPVLVLIDVRPDVEGLPVQGYESVETVVAGAESARTFVHIPSEVGAYEAEEVGVEHLLRDINDPSVSSTAGELRHKLAGVRGLRTHLSEVVDYLDAVTAGRLPANREILYLVQTLLSRLPNTQLPATVAGTHETVNDQHLVIYMAALTRSVLALHDLLANKQRFKAAEEEEASGRAAREAAAKDAAAASKAAAAAAAAAGGDKPADGKKSA